MRASISRLEVPHVLAELAERRGALDRRHGRHDSLEVLVGDPVLEDDAVIILILRRVDVVGRLVLRAMMLVAPSSAICRCASRLAPSAMASMAMTDDDAEDQAQDVRKTRSLCRVRLRMASVIG